MSANVFADVVTQIVAIFITHSIMTKCVRCAHRSKGKLGHLDASNQAFAVILSTSIVVILDLLNSANVSHVMSSAKIPLHLSSRNLVTGLSW